jgi:NADH-quinone oxidoreductase subunit H
LAECEAELVGGFHTEYNSMGFGMFFQGEYIAMLGMGALISTFFLGGWHYPGYGFLTSFDNPWVTFGAAMIGHGVWAVKALLFVVFSMWIRWTLARFRWDQLMNIGWKGVIPLALANLLLTALLHLPAESAQEKAAKKVAAASVVEPDATIVNPHAK